jgi:hypothetical protein
MISATLVGFVSFAVGQSATINDKVVRFCKDQLGKKVGDGECVSLAAEALKVAEAKPQATFKDYPNKGDYVWGRLVFALEINSGSRVQKKVPGMSMNAGDVIQLRDARFQGTNYFLTYPQHTAVILEVKKNGSALTVLEQNINGKKIVGETVYRLDDLRSGWLRVYRPVSNRR